MLDNLRPICLNEVAMKNKLKNLVEQALSKIFPYEENGIQNFGRGFWGGSRGYYLTRSTTMRRLQSESEIDYYRFPLKNN